MHCIVVIAINTSMPFSLVYTPSNTDYQQVLFQQAAEHVTRIARVLDAPSGNMMVVGVGGSGKQSLTRLASYVCGYEVRQIAITAGYGLAEFKAVRERAWLCCFLLILFYLLSWSFIQDTVYIHTLNCIQLQEMLSLYQKAGVKSTKVVLLLTDNHIVSEKFLVVVNDYLSTGIITDFCSAEDKENFCNSVCCLFYLLAGCLVINISIHFVH